MQIIQEIASSENLYRAWRKVRQNKGSIGIDGISIGSFEKELEIHIAKISESLVKGTYAPFPVEPFEIPKENGAMRKIGILAVRDRLVQRAVLNVIEPICERAFLDCSFAYRPNRSIQDAADRIQSLLKSGYVFAADMDITDFFGSLRHDFLLTQLRRFIADEAVVDLIEQWLAIGILDGISLSIFEKNGHGGMSRSKDLEMENEDICKDPGVALLNEHQSFSPLAVLDHPVLRDSIALLRDVFPYVAPYLGRLRPLVNVKNVSVATLILGGGLGLYHGMKRLPALKQKIESRRTEAKMDLACGTVQGAPISPILANIYLHSFDERMSRKAPGHLIHFGDDFLVLCKSERKARKAYALVEESLSEFGLRINASKSRISSLEAGFEFLGYLFTEQGLQKVEGA